MTQETAFPLTQPGAGTGETSGIVRFLSDGGLAARKGIEPLLPTRQAGVLPLN